MSDKLMYIPNDDKQRNSSVDYSKRFKRLDTKLKIVKPTNNKTSL